MFVFCFQADSDAHSTTSSASPAQSPSYSNLSDDGSDIESKQRRPAPSSFSFLDRSYWKRWTIALIMRNKYYWFDRFLIDYSKCFLLSLPPVRQKVCCGIVYKGRFGEVIIDPRLFKPCCSSTKQKTLAPTPVSTHLPDPLPPQLPEDVKETWWLPLLKILQ